MSGWTCPQCGRRFAHRDQQHACAVSDISATLDSLSPALRTIVERLLAVVRSWPGVHIEYASGSFMVKAPATFCSFRPRSKDVQVSFILGRAVDEFPIAKHRQLSVRRTAHALFVDSPEGADAQLVSWLEEAYERCVASRKHSGPGQD